MSKRGNVEIKEIIEVLIAVVAVGFLIVLMVRIFSPTLTVPELTAKNYLESLETSLNEAKKTGSSEFFMYSSEPNPYFLVYFGEGYSFDTFVVFDNMCSSIEGQVSQVTFNINPDKAKKNNLCICYIDSEDSITKYSGALNISCNFCIQEASSFGDINMNSENVKSLEETYAIISGNVIDVAYSEDEKFYVFDVSKNEMSEQNKFELCY